MTETTDPYRRLQEHLDKMPVGYPATKSGVEINLLKEIFTLEEAQLTTHLGYKHKTLDEIYSAAQDQGESKEKT